MADEAKAIEPEDESTQRRSDWANEAEAALEGVGVALREAWEASRDARLNALESAKKAAQALGEAIDEGVAAAREKWETQGEDAPPASPEQSTASEPDVAPHVPQMSPDEGRDEED